MFCAPNTGALNSGAPIPSKPVRSVRAGGWPVVISDVHTVFCHFQLSLRKANKIAETRSKCNLQIFCKLFVMKNRFLASTL